jgi:hypothetical protein
MAWSVEGTDQFSDWYNGLDAGETDRVNEARSAFGNMKELRVSTGSGQLRILFAFDPRRTAILLLGGNKAGQWRAWYAENIPVADQLYREYLAELRQEGLIE